jgi:dTDP-4-amino-4,6-dideoxygalactose transaminase
MIRLAVPTIEEDDIQAVVDVLRSGFLVQGPNVKAFEQEYAAYVGTEHAIAVTNCTCALYLGLLALDVGAGDKVAVCTYSWPATANAIRMVGADPVFVEIEAQTFNMAPAALEAALAKDPTIKAVMPVHTFGGSADIEKLCAIASAAKVPVIEDAACALGTEQNGKRAGSFGVMGCFSLHPRKAITTGEGGMVTTNDAAVARRVRMLRNHGQDPDAARPDFVTFGHNLRMTDFQGAMGLSQMRKLERIIAARLAVARTYDRLLEGTGIRQPLALASSRHVYQSYVVLLPPELRGKRDLVVQAMKRREVETTLGTYHMPLIRYYRSWGGFNPGDFPVTDDVAERALSLPIYEKLSDEDQRNVIRLLKESVAEVA